jgi:hypothetical protein
VNERPDSLKALEDQVPDQWVSSMWDDVQGALGARPRPGRPRRRWAMPLLAAAVVALLMVNGLTLRALRRAEARSAVLTEQLLDQQRRLVGIEAAAAPRSGRAERRVASLGAREAWLRALEGRGDLTVSDLRVLLRELPAGTTVVSASRSSALAGARFMPAAWREAFAGLDATAGVTAEELLGVLDALNLPGGASVPTARLIELLS